MAKQYNDPDLFGIIGIGRFGSALALELVKNGKDVIALDNDPLKLESVKKEVSHVYLIDRLSKDALAEADIASCGTVIVCIGKDVESNLLATLNARELGVPKIISKAINADHGRILEKLGAEVVLPEEDMGRRLAQSLCVTKTLDWLPLCKNFSLIEVDVPRALDGRSVLSLDLRKKHGINIIALIHGEEASGLILPDTILRFGDQMVIAGSNNSLSAFQDEHRDGV